MIRQYIVHDDYADTIRVEGQATGNVSIEFIVDGDVRTMVLTPPQQDEFFDAIGHAAFDASQLKDEFEKTVVEA